MLYKKHYACIVLVVCLIVTGALLVAGGCREKKKAHHDDREAAAIAYSAWSTAPVPRLEWVKQAGGPGRDFPSAIELCADGSIVIAGLCDNGAVFGAGEPTETLIISPVPINSFVAKYNPDGSFVWAKHVEGVFDYIPTLLNKLLTYSDGSVLASGIFRNASITFAPGEANEITIVTADRYFETIIARYGTDGVLEWARKLERHESRYFESHNDGSVITAGDFENSIVLGPGEGNETTLVSEGDTDICVAKYNSDGTLAWARSAGGIDKDSFSKLDVLEDGSITILGYISENGATFGRGESSETTLYNNTLILARFDPDGSLEWARGIYATYPVITFSPDGSVFQTGAFPTITGSVFGSGDANETTLKCRGLSDIFIAKYNSDGTFAWAKAAGGSKLDEGRSIVGYVGNSVIVEGFFEEQATFGSGFYQKTLYSDKLFGTCFTAKYNGDGTLAWVVARYMGAAATLDDGTIYSLGFIYGDFIIGEGDPNETTLTSRGEEDIFIAKYRP
jgi:hypothetical protein